jgi:hypothetical protein
VLEVGRGESWPWFKSFRRPDLQRSLSSSALFTAALAFDCWRGTGSTLRCYLQHRENNDANAGHEKPRAKLTGAAGTHISSTRRVRHYWLANIDIAAAFIWHNHAVSWASGDDPGGVVGPRVRPRRHGGAIDCGSRRTRFPHFIMARRLPTTQLLRLGCRAIHVLKYLEKAVHPRWPMTFGLVKPAVGVIILLLAVVLLLTPMPLSDVAPAMVISMISLAYVEEDGLLLSAGFLAAIILIGITSAAVWGAIVSAILISA